MRYSRGKMTILDGRGLERASCECYAAGVRVYERLLSKERPHTEPVGLTPRPARAPS
jgi:hypothetical protein